MKLIPLTQGKFAKVDDGDFGFLQQFKWRVRSSKRCFYAVRTEYLTDGKRKIIRMHRDVMGVTGAEIIDHINHDGLDNQKSNLRICTNAQNMRNRSGLSKNSTSGFRGVSFCKQTGRWKAHIRVDLKKIHLGRHDTPELAYAAYLVANKKYFGAFGGSL